MARCKRRSGENRAGGTWRQSSRSEMFLGASHAVTRSTIAIRESRRLVLMLSIVAVDHQVLGLVDFVRRR